MVLENVIVTKIRNARATIKQLLGLINDPKYSASYFPYEAHKSKWNILSDNLLWWLKHKEVNHFYYVYGLDRKEKEAEREVLPYKEFRMIRDRQNLKRSAGYNYVCLLRDKFVFGQFVKSLGVNTPRNIALLNNSTATLLDTGNDIPLSQLPSEPTVAVDGFCKQLAGLCGEGAFPLKISNGRMYIADKEISVEELRDRMKGQFMFQERITQHQALSGLHPQSVNTLRIITFNNGGKVEVFSATLRIGTGGKAVDNWASGGIIVGIDVETGKLRKYGLFKPGYGGRVEDHPDTGLAFDNYKIPYFSEAIDGARKLHRFLYGIHSIGWDVAITSNGPVFIEGNDDWDGSIPMSVENNFRSRFMNMFSRKE